MASNIDRKDIRQGFLLLPGTVSGRSVHVPQSSHGFIDNLAVIKSFDFISGICCIEAQQDRFTRVFGDIQPIGKVTFA